MARDIKHIIDSLIEGLRAASYVVEVILYATLVILSWFYFQQKILILFIVVSIALAKTASSTRKMLDKRQEELEKACE